VYEERTSDRLQRQSAHFSKRQSDPGLGPESRMTAGEYQSQAIVPEHLVVIGFLRPGGIGSRRLPQNQVPKSNVAADSIDSLVPSNVNQPGARIVGYASLRPAFEGRGKSFLPRLLGQIEISQETDQGRKDPACLPGEDLRQAWFAGG
jgi:hypothetical protein